MPAAAAIPAPIAYIYTYIYIIYIEIVAVQKLVVGILLRMTGLPSGCASGSALTSALDCVVLYLGRLT